MLLERRHDSSEISVLMVAADLWPWQKDGVGNVVFHLSNALAATGRVDVTVLGTVGESLDPRAAGYHPSIRICQIRTPRVRRAWDFMLLQRDYAASFLRWSAIATRNSVVHMHVLPGARAFALMAAVLMKRCPYLVTVHGWPPLEIAFFEDKLRHWADWYLSRVCLAGARNLIVNSTFVAALAAPYFPRGRLRVVPNAPDHELWRIVPSEPQKARGIRFIFWGRIYARKGPGLALLAFKRYLEMGGGADDRLVMYGKGPQEGSMRTLAARLGISENVDFVKSLEDRALVMLVASCDVVVLPSHHEPFGITIFEAMACGKPVITTAEGGPREFLENGAEAIIVPRSAEHIATAMLALARDADLRGRLGRRGRQRALQFTWRGIAPQYLKMYHEALDRRIAPAWA